ncbi:hypothetical protein RBSWK_01210 [Rhodopirellula baltica SWK14]|uniref:Uncharacterized protein n=1 Tax=Rhodopirellula baltica SWK14 TaxID=993516 RepID=L7CMR6_RHOBT|nr:hypothetical protein RBSWK_01210 [Rhodopirellula baltica SWK14]
MGAICCVVSAKMHATFRKVKRYRNLIAKMGLFAGRITEASCELGLHRDSPPCFQVIPFDLH